MTLRTKTVEYAFAPSIALVATATARNFPQLAALYIPETTGRTFRSVILEVACEDNVATAASVTAVLMGVALGGVAIDTATVTQTITNSGENCTYLWTRDVTAYFVTNYTGTSMTADARLTVTGPSTHNAYAKLIITYEYDDSATTQLKTVKIPIDGSVGNLTTSFSTIGGVSNQIPLLDEFLPEAAKFIRSYFFQMDTHTGTSGAATSALTMRYDGATSVPETSWGFTLGSDTTRRRIDNLSGLSTSSASSIEALVTSTTASPFPCISGVLVITYSFTPFNGTTLNGAIDSSVTSINVTSASGWPTAPYTIQVDNEKLRVTNVVSNTLTVTRGFDGTTAASHADLAEVLPTILNSVVLTAVDEAGWCGGTATGDKGRFARTVLVTEPGFIQLRQSGVFITLNDSNTVSLDLRVGSQPSRVFVHGAAARCGMMSVMRRIDAGASGGAGMTLARGYNDLVVDYFSTSGTVGNLGSNISGLVYLNYTSGQSAFGGGDHNHTVTWRVLPYETGGLAQKKTKAAAGIRTPIIPETNYYVMAVSYVLMTQTSGTTSSNLALTFQCEVQSGEAEGAGWRAIYSALYSTDAEIGNSIMFARGRSEFKRWPSDPDTSRLDVETARDYRFDVNLNNSTIWQGYMLLTYNSITFSKTIAITGSGGGTVNVSVRRAGGEDNEGMLLWSGSRTGDGNVTATLFEDTSLKFTETRENDTLVGRSGNWT